MKNKKNKKFSSLVKTDDSIWEMVFNQESKITEFVGLENDNVVRKASLEDAGEFIYPYPPENNLVSNKVVLFPSQTEEYVDEATLIQDIKNFIHKYLEVSEFFEQVVPFYVLLTWIYDAFKELPYLRAIGDYGCGKSRFLKVIGAVCYKPSFMGGATNPAPIFRIIEQFRGTLIIDEADMRFSDTNSEIVKILNNGFQTGMSVLRCSGDKNKNNEVESYNVFGPKIVATRERYEDRALESRFIVEQMDGRLTRQDIQFNLEDAFDEEALQIRNKCLLWRLRNYGKKTLDRTIHDWTVEPRLMQVATPLLSIIDSKEIRAEMMDFIKKYNNELITDRGFSFEAPILQIIIDLVNENDPPVTMGRIADRFNSHVVKGEKELSARKVGIILKEKFKFRTERHAVGYVLDIDNYKSKIERLKLKYGLDDEHMNVMNVVQEAGESEDDILAKEMGLYFKDNNLL